MEQHTLESQVLIKLGIELLGPARGSQAQKLRQDEKAIMERLLGTGLGLLLELANSFSLLLLVLLGQSLLELRLLGCGARSILQIDLLVLRQLLLKLGELCLEGRLLQYLGLLVGVDDLLSDKLVQVLALVLGDETIGLGGVGLETQAALASNCSDGKPGLYLILSRTYNLLVDVADVP